MHYFFTKDQGDLPAGSLSTYSIADHSFKCVIVKGNIITKNGVTAIDLKKMSYEEVMDHFGLEHYYIIIRVSYFIKGYCTFFV